MAIVCGWVGGEKGRGGGGGREREKGDGGDNSGLHLTLPHVARFSSNKWIRVCRIRISRISLAGEINISAIKTSAFRVFPFILNSILPQTKPSNIKPY